MDKYTVPEDLIKRLREELKRKEEEVCTCEDKCPICGKRKVRRHYQGYPPHPWRPYLPHVDGYSGVTGY